MSRLRLFLLGLPRVTHAGAPVKIDRRKAVALLAYLAVTGSSHSRDTLATLLWPEFESSRAYAYLRNILWLLNQTPVAEWLKVSRETVELRREADLWLDVDLFRGHLAACRTHDHADSEVCAACLPLLTEAVSLYQSDFLTGFTLSDSTAFDEWQLFEAEALRQELAGALEKLVRFHGAREEFDTAIAYGRRWLALDPLNEPVHRHLMTLYARSGQRAAALRQYEECVRILKEGLGLAPGRKTAELHERIRAGESSAVDERRAALPLHNLPAQPTPFVGREAELADIRRLLKDPECRLLTIVGLGGSGKTRLALQAALQVASEWTDAFRDGVFFASLAPVSALEFIVPVIIDALRAPLHRQDSEMPRISQRGAKTLQTQFLDYLRHKQMLLVLDNVEHLLPPASGEDGGGAESLIVEILRCAPGVKLLLTSRERLNMRSEWVLEIAGLRFPAEEAETVPDAVETYSAVQLFLQSARRADVGFSPTAADLAAVAHICQLVEGVPLGIELAAAWVKMLSCQEIVTEIEASLDFLTAALRDVPERHRSLRAVFAQSWALLSGDGRACFRKLAVFRGGFTREAARDVAGASLAALSSLMDKSLLHRTPTGRYEMLEVLRQYAEERLRAVPRESDVVRDRHAEHYLALLKRLEPSLKGAGQKTALEELSWELENVRVAWRWAVARGKAAAIAGAAMSLFLYYDIRSRFQEGAEMFREAATALSEQDTDLGLSQEGTDPGSAEARYALLGLLLVAQGWFLQFVEPAECQTALQRGMEVLEPLGPRKELAFANILCLYVNAWSPIGLGQRLRESVAVYEACGDRWGIALAMDALSYVLCRTDGAAAERCARQSLDLRRQLGDRWGMALSLYTLAWVAEHQRMPQVAKQHYRESLELRRALGEDLEGIMQCLQGIGCVARRMGDYDEARRLYLESLTLSRETGSRLGIARSLEGLGLVAYDLGKYAETKRNFEECVALYKNIGAGLQMARSIATLGSVALALGDYEEARRCFEKSLKIEAGNPWASLGFGRLFAASGDEAMALGYFRQALRRAMDQRADTVVIDALIGVARLRFTSGAPERAVELLGLVLNHHALSHRVGVRVEGLLSEAADLLTSGTVEAALARGRVRDLRAVTGEILRSVET